MQTPCPSTPSTRTNRKPARATAWLLTAFVAFALVGCASTVSTKVTRFNQWPADALGQSFSFTPPQAPRELEIAAYQALVAKELQRQGLRPAAGGQTGRFVVRVDAALAPRERKVLEAVYDDNWVYQPLYRDRDGRLHGGHWVPDLWGPRYVGDREVTRTTQESRVQVRIEDRAGAPASAHSVFDATAVHEGRGEDLVEIVPWLVRAMFTDFPGSNGQVRRITYDLDKP